MGSIYSSDREKGLFVLRGTKRQRRQRSREREAGAYQSRRKIGTHILLLLLLTCRLIELLRPVGRHARPEWVQRLGQPRRLRHHRPLSLPRLLLPHGDTRRSDVAERVEAVFPPAGEHSREFRVALVAAGFVPPSAAGSLRLLFLHGSGSGGGCRFGSVRRFEPVRGRSLLLRRRGSRRR